jgi:hypothetical protein
MNEISEYEYKRNKVRITYIPERGGFFVSINNRLLPGKSAPKWKLFKRLIAGSFKKANKLTIDRDSFFSQQYLSRAVPDLRHCVSIKRQRVAANGQMVALGSRSYDFA